MPSLLFSATKSPPKGKDEVYVAALPLRAAMGPPQLLFSALHSLNLWDFQHYLVVIKPISSQSQIICRRTTSPKSTRRSRTWLEVDLASEVLVYDFQPKEPESVYVAVAALARKLVPGVVQMRKLANLPKRRCWFVGHSNPNSIDLANKFSEGWDTDLRVGEHDCRHYATGLVEYLTGEQQILDRLRRNSNG